MEFRQQRRKEQVAALYLHSTILLLQPYTVPYDVLVLAAQRAANRASKLSSPSIGAESQVSEAN